MKLIGLFFLTMMVPLSGFTQDLAGRWDGAVIVRPAVVEVGLTLSLHRETGGDWTGVLFSPTHHRKELRVEDLYVEGKKVSFLALGESEVSQFQGDLSADGAAIEGEVLEGGKRAPFRLRRIENPDQTVAITELTEGLQKLRSTFNEDQDDVRLLMILSPGCSDCRMKVFLVHQYILDKIQDPRLSVYIVWEKVSQGDSIAMARDVSWLPADRRVKYFWSEQQLAGRTFNRSIALANQPAWDVFLVYPAGQRWADGVVPQPESFMHNLPPQYGLPKGRTFNVLSLEEQVKGLLARPRGAETEGSRQEINLPTGSTRSRTSGETGFLVIRTSEGSTSDSADSCSCSLDFTQASYLPQVAFLPPGVEKVPK